MSTVKLTVELDLSTTNGEKIPLTRFSCTGIRFRGLGFSFIGLSSLILKAHLSVQCLFYIVHFDCDFRFCRLPLIFISDFMKAKFQGIG